MMGILNRLKAFIGNSHTKQIADVKSVRSLDHYDSFRIEVDNCIFFTSQDQITRDTVSPEAGFGKNFDMEERNYKDLNVIMLNPISS